MLRPLLTASAPAVCRGALALVFVGALAPAASAGIALGDFEAKANTAAGALNTLTYGPNDFYQISVATPQSFGLTNPASLNLPGTAAFGKNTLQPFRKDSAAPFVVNFAQPLSMLSADFGDFGGQTDALSLKAFSAPNGGGTQLASATDTLATSAGSFGTKTLTVNGTGIRSAVLLGGPSGMDSAFLDNFMATPQTTTSAVGVPLPTALAAFPLGAAVAWLAARRWRATRTTFER